MFFLGVDPGYARLGYGVISFQKGDNFPEFIETGVIETSADVEESQRLVIIENAINKLLNKYKIEYASVEAVFFKKNLTTGVNLIQARGVVLLCLAKKNISYFSPSPTSVKKMITGSGSAGKKQIQNMVVRLLGLKEIPKPDDAADGLALSIYAWLKNTQRSH